MARFFLTWRVNPSAPWPTDPSKNLEFLEKMWTVMDAQMKKGEIEDWGAFPEVSAGYAIMKDETVDLYRNVGMFYPYIVFEVHEIIPYEKSKEITRAVTKAQIAAMKKK